MTRISNHRWAIDITEMMNVMLRLVLLRRQPHTYSLCPSSAVALEDSTHLKHWLSISSAGLWRMSEYGKDGKLLFGALVKLRALMFAERQTHPIATTLPFLIIIQGAQLPPRVSTGCPVIVQLSVKTPEGHRNPPAFWRFAVTESIQGSRVSHGAQMSGRKLSVFAQLQKWGLKKGWEAHRKSPSFPGHQDSVWSFHNLAAHDSRYSNMTDGYRHFPNNTVLLKRKKKAQERLNKSNIMAFKN